MDKATLLAIAKLARETSRCPAAGFESEEVFLDFAKRLEKLAQES